MNEKKRTIPIRIVTKAAGEEPGASPREERPGAGRSEEEWRREVVDLLANALVEAHRRKRQT